MKAKISKRTMSNNSIYQNPLVERYASRELISLFSPQTKHSTWRKLWVALAEGERELGLPITEEQIIELSKHTKTIDFDVAAKYEQELHHDVMAHIKTYGDQCPSASGIIHLGATSCYVTDNTDIIIFRRALKHIQQQLTELIKAFSLFADKHASLPCLGFTHFQPAQLTTVGKRATLWIQDLFLDLEEITHRLNNLKFLGVKGTTGTQASFLSLFNGDEEKVVALDKLVARKMGFEAIFPISGQTYTRKVDAFILNTLAGIATSIHKCGTDIRLLSSLKELEEPFSSKQVGSSAMPYKRNPILSERACSLARFVISLSENGSYTAATQWLERSLDDSANRRISLPEAFLATDAILALMTRIATGLSVNNKVIAKHVNEELPFMATENILMYSVKAGGDRQELHERIRAHSLEAHQAVKEHGGQNPLIAKIAEDPAFPLNDKELSELLNIKAFIGRAPEQVQDFLTLTRNSPLLREETLVGTCLH